MNPLFIGTIVYLCLLGFGLLIMLPKFSNIIEAFKRPKRYTNDRKNKLCVLVPARNESQVIGLCLNSIQDQDYPAGLFDVHVIVKDHFDPTLDIARRYGYKTHIVPGQTCKGEALDGALHEILASGERYDAYVIVDADNLAAPDFLTEMNNALASGRQIICGKKRIKNWLTSDKTNRTIFTNCAALVWTMIDEFGNARCTRKNIPIKICGTGMLARADVIEKLHGWPYRTLTEDYEMTVDSILKGFTSAYYPFAEVWTEEAISKKMVTARSMRWVKGYVQCDRRYRREVFHKTFLKRSRRVVKRNLNFLYGIAPVIYLTVLQALYLVYNAVFAVAAFLTATWNIFFASVTLLCIGIGIMWFVLFLFTCLIFIVKRKEINIGWSEKVRILLFNPFFICGWAAVFFKAVLSSSDSMGWEEIERGAYDAKALKGLDGKEHLDDEDE